MRLVFVGYHPPQETGSAAGRQLLAVGQAMIAAGHEVSAWCWRPEPPKGELPDWCEWRALPRVCSLRVRGRALLMPRTEVARIGWTAPADAVVVADDPGSWPAVAGRGRSALSTVHFSVALDQEALPAERSLAGVQDRRGERRAVRQPSLVWALSDRVRDRIGKGVFVPGCVPLPATTQPLVDEPTVGLLADWSWAPNVAAADSLVRSWPEVTRAVPGARLLLAGRGPAPVGTLAGVSWLGEVPSVADLLARTAVFAFPCPPTSGPKMKVMDAMAHGVAVATTPAGVEGIVGGADAAAVSSAEGLGAKVVALLTDPAGRARLAAAGRSALERGHAPAVAAQARLATLGQHGL